MVRVYKRKLGARSYSDYSQSSQDAVQAVKEGMSLREASDAYSIPKSTTCRIFVVDEFCCRFF